MDTWQGWPRDTCWIARMDTLQISLLDMLRMLSGYPRDISGGDRHLTARGYSYCRPLVLRQVYQFSTASGAHIVATSVCNLFASYSISTDRPRSTARTQWLLAALLHPLHYSIYWLRLTSLTLPSHVLTPHTVQFLVARLNQLLCSFESLCTTSQSCIHFPL